MILLLLVVIPQLALALRSHATLGLQHLLRLALMLSPPSTGTSTSAGTSITGKPLPLIVTMQTGRPRPTVELSQSKLLMLLRLLVLLLMMLLLLMLLRPARGRERLLRSRSSSRIVRTNIIEPPSHRSGRRQSGAFATHTTTAAAHVHGPELLMLLLL